jgi:GNAT superfamily N-acetyltransferase/pyrimidine deaminase RibD-like protein
MNLDEIESFPSFRAGSTSMNRLSPDPYGRWGETDQSAKKNLEQVRKAARQLPGSPYLYTIVPQRSHQRSSPGKGYYIYVLTPDGEVIGGLDIDDHGKMFEVDKIQVLPKYQGQGLGMSLYGIALSILKKPLVAGTAQTPDSQRAWLRLSQIPGVQVMGLLQMRRGLEPFYKWKVDELGAKPWIRVGNHQLYLFPVTAGKKRMKVAQPKVHKIYGRDTDELYTTMIAFYNQQPVLESVQPTVVQENPNAEISQHKKLDRVLIRLCEMLQAAPHPKFGMVAAAVIDPDNRIVAALNRRLSQTKNLHAEPAAMQAYEKRYGAIPDGSIIVTTLSPCAEPMAERQGQACVERINQSNVHKVYCGYMDHTQHEGLTELREFTLEETANPDIRRLCKKYADTFLEDDLQEVKIDNRKGAGAVPFNQEIDYMGLRVGMTPQMFLKLALPLDVQPSDQKTIDRLNQIKDTQGFGAPFLYIEIPEQWFDGDFSKLARVSSHDGRHRMLSILASEGNDPVEVHLLLRNGLRRRDLTDQMIERLQAGMISQTGAAVRGPVFAADTQGFAEDYDPNGTPPGPEFKPTMPAGTVKVDVSDVYDWYKLGQHISNLKGLGKHDFGQGPPSTIFSFGSEEEEHKYIKDLEKTGLTTTDIDPVDPNQPRGMPRQKTDPTYNVGESATNITELWTQPYELTSRVTGPANMEYYFDTKDNRSGRIVFDSVLDTDQGGLHAILVIVHFYIDNVYHTSGKGDAVAIFSTVVAACRDYLRRYKPPVVAFETDDPKKRNLYVKMAGMFPDYVVYPYPQWGQDPIVGDVIFDSLMDGNAKDAVVLHRRNYDPEKTRMYIDEQEPSNDTAISLSKLGKFHRGADTLAEFVPERAAAQYALHPDKWESTFYSLTNKDSDKLKYYGPKKISIPPGTLVGDMAIANKFYRAKTAEEKQQYAELYRQSLKPYPVDVSEYRMPELLIPQQGVAEDQVNGIKLKVHQDDDGLIVKALANGKTLGYAEFFFDKEGNLDPQDLTVLDPYQKQGIAKAMYDHVKSLGYNIVRSWSQTSAGKGFWDKHRGEDVKMWEQSVAEGSPNFNREWDEATRYPEFVNLGKEKWIELVSKGKPVTVTRKNVNKINNTDAADPKSFKLLDPEKQKRVLAQLANGDVEMPIVARYSDGYLELIGGNTRLTAQMAKDGQAKVWLFNVPEELTQGVAENFADGKVKGKSRPGRVKRAGASCNGSVTDLRRRAKNASGEKAKMYHWCANMKSGRSKNNESQDTAAPISPQAWIDQIHDMYPQTWQNNHVMPMGGEGEDQQFAMFELVPSTSKKNAVDIKWFQAYPLRQGVGSRAMQHLQQLAREADITLTLYPWDKGRVSQAKLMKFYRGQGFQPTVKGSKNMFWSPDKALESGLMESWQAFKNSK